MGTARELEERLEAAGQGHLVAHARGLDGGRREEFARQLAELDLELLARLQAEAGAPAEEVAAADLEPLPAVVKGADPEADRLAREDGERRMREGRVAAFLVAGGQGSRLGHEGPKGTFPATPIARKTLFRLFAEKLLARSRRAGRAIPLYVMTSPDNDAVTRADFAEHGSFGLDPDDVTFLVQGTMPAVDGEGRVLLAAPGVVFRSPDGHGGSLKALHVSGALDDMRRRGVEDVFYFQVDNPLAEVCDPAFLGHHARTRSEFSSKAVPKSSPGEKVGILVSRRGRPAVIEYSDLPAGVCEARDEDGALRFRAGNIAIHVIRRTFVEELNRHGFSLPFHRARKKIPSIDGSGRPVEVEGVKFETFVFDALPRASATLVLEVDRSEEFSPIKNREGGDSPATARRDQVRLHARWLERAGVRVPRDAAGEPRHLIEIAPLFADSAGALAARHAELPAEVAGDLLLEER